MKIFIACFFLFIFYRTEYGGFLACFLVVIQLLNGVKTNSVAISLMLNHNLTGLENENGAALR